MATIYCRINNVDIVDCTLDPVGVAPINVNIVDCTTAPIGVAPINAIIRSITIDPNGQGMSHRSDA